MFISMLNDPNIFNVSISERMKILEVSFDFNTNAPLEYEYFNNILKFIPSRDKIKIILQDCSESILNIHQDSNNREEYDMFLKNTLKDDEISVKIEVSKQVENNNFSIYSFEDFSKDLLSLSLEDIMRAFSSLLKNIKAPLIINTFGQIPLFTTKTMFFIPNENCVTTTEFNREKRIKDCKEISYFYNFNIYEVIPDDFKIDVDYIDNPLSKTFEKIATLLSISFIASSSAIDNNQIKGVINGQRTMEYSCMLDDLFDNKILYKIYNWIYTDGNVVDKAIIARNVISLHCRYTPIIETDEKILASIQSNFNLYLKDNVIQYLELKNKVAEFISGIVSKTGEYATEILDNFKTNLIAIFGFIFTVILANIVSDQPLDNIFTKDITALMECVLVGSLAYLLICLFQASYQINKVYDSYEDLKCNYNTILTTDDLSEIFKNDQLINKTKKTIKKSKRIYLILWFLSLIIIFIIVEFLSVYPIYQRLYNLFKLLITKTP